MPDPAPPSQAAGHFGPLVWLLTGFKGRISRSIYWAAFIGVRLVQVAILNMALHRAPSALSPAELLVVVLVLLATLLASLAVVVKRLHDAGHAGVLALFLFVPLAEVIFCVWAGIVPGEPGPNRYGKRADSPE